MDGPYQVAKPKLVWPIFDAIYDNKSALDINDSVLIGRFVLVKYSNEVIDQARRLELETGAALPETDNEIQYMQNFHIDGGKISKDRIVYQKQAIVLGDNTYAADYVEICYLNEAGADQYKQIEQDLLRQWAWDDTYLWEEK